MVSTPSAVKSFMLKFLELCHTLDGQKNLLNELSEKKAKKKFSLSSLLGFVPQTGRMPNLTVQERTEIKGQTDLAVRIFEVFRDGVEIMDEVDLILHPLKSELNWPLGMKEPLDFTRSRAGNGLRWNLPAHLYDAILSCSGMPILADMADSKEAGQILDDLAAVITQGLVSLSLLSTPHIALVSKNFYDSHMKPILARWLVLWIRAHKLPKMSDTEISEYLIKGQHASAIIIDKVRNHMADEHVKILNLGHDWLDTFLPFTLQKINRVHFGLLQPRDVELLENDGVKIPSTRKLMAVPFVGKDVPSRASEFAHPDILIGLTILAFRYEGLRPKDFTITIRHMQERLADESGLFKDRPTFQRFEQWILCCGKFIRGSKRRPKPSRRKPNGGGGGTGKKRPPPPSKPKRPSSVYGVTSVAVTSTDAAAEVNIFAEIFKEVDDGIWPLQLIEPRDREQSRVLFALLAHLPHAVMYFLNDIIFPEVLAHQGLKLSTCGQELGGNILFGRRIGFSGTPSDIVPLELGGCQYERGSDGRVVHYLLSPRIMSTVTVEHGWDVHSLLNFIAQVIMTLFL